MTNSLLIIISDERLIFHQKNKEKNNGFIINQLSDKLIELYEKQILEKEIKIKALEEELSELKKNQLT